MSVSIRSLSKVQKHPNNRHELQMWSSPKVFYMVLLCWTVGGANCWKFAQFAKRHYGGNYLLVYITMTVFLAIPVTYMEMGLGQYSNKTVIQMWSLCPIFKGLGYGSLIILTFTICNYNMVNTFILFYLLASMPLKVPWSECDPAWSKINCFTYERNTTVFANCVKMHGDKFCRNLPWENSAQHFLKQVVLNGNYSTRFGTMYIIMAILSTITSFLTFLINIKGTKSVEKWLKFLTYYPYLSLIVMLFLILIDAGSFKGMIAFFTTKLSDISSKKIYRDVLQQMMLSLGLGLGGYVCLGSQAHFRNPVHKQAIALNIIDVASSIGYSVLIFSSLGSLSFHLNMELEFVMKLKGYTIFSTLPLAMLYLPGSTQFWGILFYSGAYFLGVRSQALMVFTVLNTMYDQWNYLLEHTFLCSLIFNTGIVLLGFPIMLTKNLATYIEINDFITGYMIVIWLIFEIIGIMWFYGLLTFVDDLHFMLGFKQSLFWKIGWFLAPLLLILGYGCIRILYFEEYSKNKYKRMVAPYLFTLLASLVLMFLTIMITKIVMRRKAKIKFLQPSEDWGPSDPVLKKSREMFSAHSMTKEYMYRKQRQKRTDAEEESSSDDDIYC